MKIELTHEQMELQEKFREFANTEIAKGAEQFDREEKIPDEVVKKMSEEGYLGSMISGNYGGMGWDSITIGLLNEEFGKACSSVRCILTVHGMLALAIQRWGSDEQKDYWLPRMAKGEVIGAFGLTEPNVGSDAKSIETTAIKEDGKYILNGTKKWITMGQIADLFLIFAKCEEKVTAFLVPRDAPGLKIKPLGGLVGMRASMTTELKMKDCLIDESNIIGKIGTGLSHVGLSSLDYGRYTVACGCIGIAQACLEQSIRYARERKQFGKPLRKYQSIQKMITEMVVNIDAARLLCQKAGYLRDIGDPDSIMQVWTAKYFASIMVNKVANDALQIHGANGCSREYPIERYMRDARIAEIIEGTTQMHEILISSNAFRNY